MSVEDRLARIEARAGIEAVMQVYAAAADAKYTARHRKAAPKRVAEAARAQAACFTPDAEWQAGGFGGSLHGRAAIEDFFREGPWSFATHLYTAPQIEVAGTAADARWRLWELGVRDESNPATQGHVTLLTGVVRQSWRLLPEGWRIAVMAFDQLHALTLATDTAALSCLIPAGDTP
ncbi:nuclear transport factor 2 family protein [Pararhodobacter aggregans]|nr:nuclear transport factor 2 family protein [Pararhodobacter aggregans]PTX03256.1 SnoaL-like protein [Pararhodobacter aggregans]